MSATVPLTPFIPSEEDVKLAKETKKILAPRLSSTSPFDLRAINPLDLPGKQHAAVDEFLDRLRQVSDTKIMPS